MNINEFIDYVEYITKNEVPTILLKHLNLGIQVSNKKKKDDEEKNYYIMGEYIQDITGNQIVLYFGSFQYFLRGKHLDVWQKEIMDTIKHELTHHIEAMAGQEELAFQEDNEVANRKNNKDR